LVERDSPESGGWGGFSKYLKVGGQGLKTEKDAAGKTPDGRKKRVRSENTKLINKGRIYLLFHYDCRLGFSPGGKKGLSWKSQHRGAARVAGTRQRSITWAASSREVQQKTYGGIYEGIALERNRVHSNLTR